MTTQFALSLLTSVGTLTGMWLVSKHRWEGWAVGLANQVVWLAFIVVTGAWGLLLLMSALVVIYTHALVTWRREEMQARAAMADRARIVAAREDRP